MSAEAADSLAKGDIQAFVALAGLPSDDAIQSPFVEAAARMSPQLPPPGYWQYKVFPVTELGGAATAKGTALRMQEVLNTLAMEGWELVTTSERDSRWLGGETIILTLRRFVVSEGSFRARFEAEERIRLEVKARLATEPT